MWEKGVSIFFGLKCRKVDVLTKIYEKGQEINVSETMKLCYKYLILNYKSGSSRYEFLTRKGN